MPTFPWTAVGLFALLFAISLVLQIRSGAWKSDFGGHADEAAHVVTSLMLRDYLAGGFLETPHPLRFAEAYYDRYPKVAIGHYPPGFYLVAGIALLPVRSGAALLLLMNLLSAGAGLLVWSFGCRILRSPASAAVVAILYGILPQTRTYTAIVMADLLLVCFCLLAARSFVRFLEFGNRRDSLGFGWWAAAAILTKGSGVGLALLPPVALVLASKWRWFLKPALWLAPLPVLLLTVPWMWLTVGITSEGMQDGGILGWVRAALPFYGEALVREVGWTGLALLGTAAVLIRGWKRHDNPGGEECALWGLVAGGLAVALLVPAGLDSRYLMPVVPAILLLGMGGLGRLGGRRVGIFGTGVIVTAAVFIGWETDRPVRKLYTGATASIEAVLRDRGKDPSEGPARLLVVSDVKGEGAVIAAAAFRAPGILLVARGTKLLSTSDWVGRNYEPAFRSPDELPGLLAEAGVRYLVIDPPPTDSPLAHWPAFHEWLGIVPARFHRIADVPSWRRDEESHFSIYRIGE